MPNPKPDITTRKVVVAGAGLVGSLAALMASRHGYEVTLVEQRPDPAKTGWSGGRSINLAISTRGLSALEKVGLKEKALAEAIRMPGREIHSLSGETTFQSYGTEPHHCIHSISRGRLNEILLEQIAKEQSVALRFQTRAESWSPEQGWTFVSDSGERTHFQDSFLLGCDGAGSVVRKQMVSHGAIAVDEQMLDYGYKELSIPAGPGGSWKMKKEALHIWPRGRFMVIALPNLDGSFTVTLFLSHRGEISFDALKTEEQVLAFFRAYFPDLIEFIPNLQEEFKQNPVGHMGTVRSSSWYSSAQHSLLLGDAAHAIVPFFGQGMNCGFEDCELLNKFLRRPRDPDWREISVCISEERKPNSDAIATMALENFVEMRDSVGNPKFLLQKEVEKTLEKLFPGKYQSRYEMVSFSKIPYAIAWEAGESQKYILNKLCRGLDSVANLNRPFAEQLIYQHLQPYFEFWEDRNGSWH